MSEWVTFRDLDRRAGQAKGWAFRRFKALEPTLAEGRDYRVLRPDGDAAEIAALWALERIYPSSVTVVLLTPAVAERVASGRN